MSTTLNQLIDFLDLQSYRYTLDPGPQHLWLPPQPNTLDKHSILLHLSEEGQFLQFIVPQLFNLANYAHAEAVLESLLAVSYRFKMLRFEYDPSDGEVRASIELPLEDLPLTDRQFHRCLRGLIDLLENDILPLVQKALETGIMPPELNPLQANPQPRLTELGDGAAAMPLLLQLLQAEAESGGDEAAVHAVMRANLEMINPTLGEAIAPFLELILAQQPDQTESIIGLLEDACTSIRLFDGKYWEVLEISLVGYQIVLGLRQNDPPKRARTLTNLGNAYLNRAELGIEPVDNLNRAIAAYDEAAQILRQRGLDKDLSSTLTNLGIAYLNRAELGIEPVDNLNRAIAAYDEAAQILRQRGLDKDLSSTLNNLGIAYLNRAALGIEPVDNLNRAIEAYDEAAQILRQRGLDKDLSSTLTNLGNAYLNRAALGIEPVDNLNRAIAAYDEAAQILRQRGLDKDLSSTLNNLGIAYRNRAELGIEPVDNLNRAIAAYDEAAQILRQRGLDKDLSSTLNNLGNAYLNRAELGIEPVDNLNRAIAAYDEAAQILRQRGLDKDLSSTLNNLGNAYLNRAELGIEPVDNLNRAIAAYDEAAQILRQRGLDKDLSSTLTNLGIAYLNRAELGIEPVDNLNRAIAAYDEAAQILRQRGLDKDLSSTLNNLGIAYLNRAALGIEPVDNLNRAIAAYDEAAQILRQRGLDKDLSSTLNNLGNAYLNRAALGIEPVDNLNRAIAAYDEAAQILRQRGLDKDLSSTLTNLGTAYRNRAELGIEPDISRQKAIAAFSQALANLNPEFTPVECLRAGRSLGNLAFQTSDWALALQGYSKAIAAVEQTRAWASDPVRREEIHQQAIEMYLNTIQALVNLGQYGAAIEYAERSRSQQVVDLLYSNDLYPQGNIPPQAQELLAAFRAKQQQIDDILRRLMGDSNRDLVETGRDRQRAIGEALTEEVRALEQEKQTIWQALRRFDPVLAGQVKVEPLPLEAMQALLQDQPHTAILYFFCTSADLQVFILRRDRIDHHRCPQQGTSTLNHWLLESWLKPYLTDKSHWQTQIPTVLEELAQRLDLDPIIQQYLTDKDLPSIEELILVPHLYLHQMPFAALPITPDPATNNSEKQYLGDRFRLRTISSLQLLHHCTQRQPIQPQIHSIVADTHDDLSFARFESQRIAQLLDVPADRYLAGRQQATKARYETLLNNSHTILCCHHAVSRIDNPLESMLLLGDSTLPLGELMLSRYPNLVEVFLSCCETGLGTVQNLTDDILTLATGFLSAGARSVISSLWAVDDLATCLLSILYHQERLAGHDRATALQTAQRNLRQMPGQDLSKNYKKPLQKYLQAQYDLAHDAETQTKLMRWETITLPQLCQQEQPFAAPHHWAAFVCQGLS